MINFDNIGKKEINNRDYSLYEEEFYGSSDVLIYINGKQSKQIAYIKFCIKENNKPVYGYSSRTFDDIAIGNRIVFGSIKVPVSNDFQNKLDSLSKNGNSHNDFVLDNEEKVIIPDWVYGYNFRSLDDELSSDKDNNDSYKKTNNIYNNDVSLLYDKSLFYVNFGNQYDIRIHSIQTALTYMGYMYSKSNFNELKYGYYCVCTYDMVKDFQVDNGLIPTGRLCKKTWSFIFKKLLSNYGVIILKNSEKKISILHIKDNEKCKQNCSFETLNSFISDDLECDYNLIDEIIHNSMYEKIENKTLNPSLENLAYQPFFKPQNISTLRKSRFSISLIYGCKKEKCRKIIEVLPISVKQEIDTTGTPIYDVYEFIAKDVIEINN